MDTCFYACDLTDAEWALLAPLVPRSHPAGRRQTYPLWRIVDAVFYLLRTDAQWGCSRTSIHRVVPSSTIMLNGARTAWEHVTQILRESYRCKIGRHPQPTAAIINTSRIKPLR